MNKFTPGPWNYMGEIRLCGYEVKHPLYCGEVRADESDRYLGSVCEIQSADHVDGISRDEAEANARLISSAPDLLEALEGFVACWDAGASPVEFAEKARSAIAKARGE